MKGIQEVFLYLGKDGFSYSSPQDLREANEAWKRDNLKYIAKDGSLHPDMESVRLVNQRHLIDNPPMPTLKMHENFSLVDSSSEGFGLYVVEGF